MTLEFSHGMYFFVKKVGVVWRGFDGRGDLIPRVSCLVVNWVKGGITMMEITKYFMGLYNINIRCL